MGNPDFGAGLCVVLQDANHKEKERITGDFEEVLKDSSTVVADSYRAFLRGENNGLTIRRFDSKFVLVKEL